VTQLEKMEADYKKLQARLADEEDARMTAETVMTAEKETAIATTTIAADPAAPWTEIATGT